MQLCKFYFFKENSFHACAYYSNDDLAETIMNPANCCFSTVKLSIKDKINFPQPEHVYVCSDIIKPNLVEDSFMRLLTSLHSPSETGYQRFDNILYKPVEQSYIESISIRLFMKLVKLCWLKWRTFHHY